MYDTTKYIDVLPKLMINYNNSYHSGIKGIPNMVNNRKLNELNTKKFIQAKTEEKMFNIGDKVRHIINKKVFEKGHAHWSKTIYTITDKLVHSYILNNGKQPYEYYELILMTDNEKPNIINIKTISRVNQQTFEQMKKRQYDYSPFKKRRC